MSDKLESYIDKDGYYRYDCSLVDAGSETKKMKFVEQGLMGNGSDDHFQPNDK